MPRLFFHSYAPPLLNSPIFSHFNFGDVGAHGRITKEKQPPDGNVYTLSTFSCQIVSSLGICFNPFTAIMTSDDVLRKVVPACL